MTQRKTSGLAPLVLALTLDASPFPPQFTVQDLGPMEATFISNDGRVLGDEGMGGCWLWKEGGRVTLPLEGVCAVNRRGCVVGSVYAGTAQDPVFGDWFPYYRAALWEDGVRTVFGTLGGRGSTPTSLNAWQVVVGLADDSSNVRRPFIWRSGEMATIRVDFPVGGGWTFDRPLRVTDRGTIYGTGGLHDAPHAVELAPAADGAYHLIDLGGLAETGAGSISAFNDLGWAVGAADRGGWVEAFVFKDGGTTWLGNLGNDSWAQGVNNAGEVVGLYNPSSFRAFLWRKDVIYDLNSCIPSDSGWRLVDADAINDAGQIVGHGILNGAGPINGGGVVNGGHRAFLLNPRPGTDLGLRLGLLRQGGESQWLVELVNGPTSSISFEVSPDLIQWSPIAHTVTGNGFLIEKGNTETGFLRAVFDR